MILYKCDWSVIGRADESAINDVDIRRTFQISLFFSYTIEYLALKICCYTSETG